MLAKYPKRKIGIVTFDSSVDIIGDGNGETIIVSGDKLDDYEFLLKNGYHCSQTSMSRPLEESYERLQKKIQ